MTPPKEELNGDAKLAIERLRVRQELRSAHDIEDTGVIEAEASKRTAAPPASSTPPHAKSVVAVLSVLPAWQRGIVLLALLGLIGYAVGHGFKFW